MAQPEMFLFGSSIRLSGCADVIHKGSDIYFLSDYNVKYLSVIFGNHMR